MLILFPNAPARHKVSHRVLCYPLLPVKVKLPLSFLRFFAPVAGSWSFVRAPAPPAHHKTTRMHGSLRQVGHQHTPPPPPPPLSTHSQQSTWLDAHQHMRLRSDGKEAGRDIVFLFEAGGRVLDFVRKAERIHFNVLGFLFFVFCFLFSMSKEKQTKQTWEESIYFPLLLTHLAPDIRSI